MSETTVSLIDPGLVDEALDRIHQAEPVGDSALKRLVWLRLRLAQSGIPPSTDALDLELSRALLGLIEENLTRLRLIAGAAQSEPVDMDTALAAMRSDYAQENARLEAWSALYFYYVWVDLDLRWQAMANALGVDKSYLYRRTRLGYKLLADTISGLELEARAANRLMWMHLKLPAQSYSSLYGAAEALARAAESLLDPAPPHVLALTGPGGAGKTALAHALALRLVDAGEFDDLAWLSLSSEVSYPALCGMIAAEVGLLHLLEAPFEDLEAGLRVRLASTPTLVVLDGADALDAPETLFRRLGALVEPGRVLATLRRAPAAGAAARVMPVEPLPRTAMDELLIEIGNLGGSKRLANTLSGDAALAAIYAAVGGNPLAARLVAGQLATLPLDRALARLGDLRTEDEEGLFERLFEDTWTASGDGARAAAIALLVLPAEGADWNDIRRVSGLDGAQLDEALDALVASSLVVAAPDGLRYVLPALARRYVETQGQKSPWRERLQSCIDAAQRYLNLLPADPDTAPAPNVGQAISLFRQAAGLGALPDDLDRQIAQVAPAARRSGQWPAWRDLMLVLIDPLRSSGENRRGLARALTELGVAYRWLGDHAGARAAFDEAVAVYGTAGDFIGQAETLLELGLLCETLGERDAAADAYSRAAEMIARRRATALYRRALNGLASLALAASDGALALRHLEAALAATDEPPDGLTLSNMGMAYLQLGDPRAALRCQGQALAIFADEDDQPRMARAHIRLGMAHYAAGQAGEAEGELRQGLEMMRALGDALGQSRALNNLGAIFSAGNQLDEALSTWREALDLQTRLDDRVGMAYTHYNLADLLWKLGEQDKARIAFGSARDLAADHHILDLSAQIAAHPLNG